MKKSPSFQFYPEDWLSNIKLQLCSITAHGLLINLMCLMHQSEKYGYLLINGLQTNHKQLTKLLRMNYKTFNKALNELISCGVLKEDESGTLYCKRMVDDNRLREIRKEAGKLGGNPNLVKQKVKQKVNQSDNQKPTPSSSSSSSTSNTIKKVSKEKPISQKIKFLDEVFLTQKEHDRLIEDYGERLILAKIEDADEWLSQGNRRKNYTDHNKMIRKWLRKDNTPKIEKYIETKSEPVKETTEPEWAKDLKLFSLVCPENFKNLIENIGSETMHADRMSDCVRELKVIKVNIKEIIVYNPSGFYLKNYSKRIGNLLEKDFIIKSVNDKL